MNKKFVKKFYMGTDEKTLELFRRKTCDICGNKAKTTLFSVVFMVDDTRLELAERAKASSAAYPREWSRALIVTSSSCSILDETKNLQLKQVAGLWWTIQDSNL